MWDQFKPSYTIIISTITQVIYYILGREAEISLVQIKDIVFKIEHLKRVASLNINDNINQSIRFRDPKRQFLNVFKL